MESTQIALYCASRMEVLGEQAIALLAATEPADPLVASEIVVAHPGLGRWLRHEMAERRGIVANLRLLLPGQWLARLQDEWLGADAGEAARYERESLRWVLFEVLALQTEPALRSYLEGSEPARRRFQLADRLAAIYTQYLVYRRDWLAAWERGESTPAEKAHPHWQARLWREVVARAGAAHRGSRLAQLLAALRDARQTQGAAPIILFGISHLPPDLLTVLHALARHQAVHLLFPNPCEALWTDLVSERAIILAGDQAQSLHLDSGHPLLAALGGQGQDFLRQLALQADLPESLDSGHPAGESLLAQLQQSIRTLNPDLSTIVNPQDASLRVHGCHTRLRELEVLRDALLDQLVRHADLHPREIVVMAPDISAYASLLPAVFGTAASPHAADGHLPWLLADQILLHAHPLIEVFRTLLGLDRARFGADQVLGLLEVSAIARRFGLHEAERSTIKRWVTRSHIAWALDERMRREFDAPPDRCHTWAFGIDRMSWGYLAGEDAPPADGLLALSGVEGLRAEALGMLSDLLDALSALRSNMAVSRQPREWSNWLIAQLSRLFDIPSDDAASRSAFDALLQICAALSEETSRAETGTALEWDVVREFLEGRLNAIPEHQRFLAGGITFCGMVPYRTIPFRVVCVLGLDDGEFPRPERASGLNLMSESWRSGDRDAREEDRYLFLEAIMAARDALHLSYLAEGVQDGRPRNPAAPLAELLGYLQQQFPPVDGEVSSAAQPWLVRHPLQPFDQRYFDLGAQRDPRLFSFRAEYARVDPARASAGQAFANAPLPAPEVTRIAVRDFELLLRNPAEVFFTRSLQLRLEDVEDDSPDDIEPLQSSLPARARVERELFRRALTEGGEIPDTPQPWLAWSGLLPNGELGQRAYAKARDQARNALSSLHGAGIALRGLPQTIDVDLVVDGIRIDGSISDTFPQQEIILFGRGKAPRVGHLLSLHLRWLILVCAAGKHWRAVAAPPLKGMQDPLLPWSLEPSAAHASLAALCTLYRRALQRPLLFFPETSWAWCQSLHGKKPAQAIAKAREAWMPDERTSAPADSENPYFALAARGRDFFIEGSADHAEFAELAEAFCAPLLGAGIGGQNAA